MKLLDYIKGDRRGKVAHRIEKEAMDDPFLAEALEGFDAVGGDHDRAIERLRGRVESRVSGRRKSVIVRWSAVAAVLLLFLTIGGVFLLRPDEQDLPPVLAEFTPSPAPLANSPENRPMEMAQATEPELQEVRSEQNETEELSLEFQAIETVSDMIFDDKTESEISLQDFQADQKLMEALPPVAQARQRDTEETKTAPPQPSGIQRETASMQMAKMADAREDSPLIAKIEQDEDASLDEVVVIGYGVNRRDARQAETLSGSVTRAQVQSVPAPGQPADGMESFRKYIKENRTVLYNTTGEPVTGKVVLEFRINRNNRPTGIRVIESLSPEADREARRLLEVGPDWGRTDNRVRFSIEF